MKRRSAKVALGVLVVAVVSLGVWAWEPLLTKTTYYGQSGQRGWHRGYRWSDPRWPRSYGHAILWWEDSGFKQWEIFVRDGDLCVTSWNSDGSVAGQSIEAQRGPDPEATKTPPWWWGLTKQRQYSAPWLWGVTEQTEPTMPEWMKDDEKWAKAVADQGTP